MNTNYDHRVHDQKIQEEWQNTVLYACAKDSSKPLFTIDTPPPTVSGSLHIGHIFSYTQTDIIARYKRLSDYNVFYPFGFDDNGLATERFVEKKHKTSAFALGRPEFIKLCLSESHEVGKQFASLWKRMGISADWSNTYSTISPVAQKISQESFVKLFKKGFIYQKEDPSLYCTTCQTAVAQAELDSATLPSTFNHIIFTTADGQNVEIATTRPELLPSCVALLYNPHDTRYTQYAGKEAIVPLFGHTVPFIADETVEQDKGTGLVMCCTFGDKTDILWYKKHNLPYKPCIGFNGKWLETTGPLAGLKAHAAREKVLEELKAAGLLIKQEALSHAVSTHERCKKEIEFIVLKQWFLNILEHKDLFLKQLDSVTWHPAFMKARCIDWVKNLQWDWCLSRQRFYGIPFPAWHCTQCSYTVVADESLLPLDPQVTPCPLTACPECKNNIFVADTDVMDTWNTSSLTPYICLSLFNGSTDNLFEKQTNSSFLPMGMRPQAHDIIRTWALYTIIKTTLHNDTIPWTDIVISGHVLSKDRDKISKSQGNNPTDPEQLLKTYPADVIRYWTASGNLGYDVAFSETQLKIGQKLITKLWNAFRFIHEHIQTGVPAEQPQDLGTLNEWILTKKTDTLHTYQKQLDANEFGAALAAAEQFFWNDFCDNYLELIKDQLFHPELYTPQEVAATKWTLSHLGLSLLQLFAPYIPHCTDTLYGLIYKAQVKVPSLHVTSFKALQKDFIYQTSVTTIEQLIALVDSVRKLKTHKELSLKTPVTELTVHAPQEALHRLKALEPVLKGITFAAAVVWQQETGAASNSLEQRNDQWHATIKLPSGKEAA